MTKARDALRKLSYGPIDQDELRRIFRSKSDRPDYAVALLNSSVMDRMLEQLLRIKMVSKDERLLKDLFSERGPMGNLNSKIQMATALGLIEARAAEEMNMIRIVRNAFAHSTGEISFETPEVASVIEASAMTKELRKVQHWLVPEVPEVASFTSRHMFLFITHAMWGFVDSAIMTAGGASLMTAVLDDIGQKE